MAEQVKGFAEHFAGFKRHLKLAIAVAVAIMVFGVGFAYSLPDVYKSTAFILEFTSLGTLCSYQLSPPSGVYIIGISVPTIHPLFSSIN